MKNDVRLPGLKVTTPLPPNDSKGTRDAPSSSVAKFPKVTLTPSARSCQFSVRFPGKNICPSSKDPLKYNPYRWYTAKSNTVAAKYTLKAEIFTLSVPLFSTEKNSPITWVVMFVSVTLAWVETRTSS